MLTRSRSRSSKGGKLTKHQTTFIRVRQHEKRNMLIKLLEIERFDALLISPDQNATMGKSPKGCRKDSRRTP